MPGSLVLLLLLDLGLGLCFGAVSLVTAVALEVCLKVEHVPPSLASVSVTELVLVNLEVSGNAGQAFAGLALSALVGPLGLLVVEQRLSVVELLFGQGK